MKKDIIMSNIVSMETIVSKIYMIRGLKVMLDRDLAEPYKKGVGVLEVPNWHLQ